MMRREKFAIANIYRRGGDKRALIRTIVTCSRFNVKLPAWAREAIVEAYLSIPKSWDDVFGRPVAVAKGKSVEAERRRRRIGTAVIRRVRELNSQREPKREPIGPALFRKVGKEFGVSGGIVSKIYYDEEMMGTFKLLNDPDRLHSMWKSLGWHRSQRRWNWLLTPMMIRICP